MTSLVERDKAITEVNKWLDYKKVSENKRGDYKVHIDTLVDAVEMGFLSLEEDYSWTQKLQDEAGEIKELKFKPRLRVSTAQNHLDKVKATDGDGRMLAYISALTSTNKGLLKNMYTEDYSIASAITVFFV